MTREDELPDTRAMLQQATRTYLRLQAALLTRIDALALQRETLAAGEVPGDEPAASKDAQKRLHEEITHLQRALTTCMEYENRLAKELERRRGMREGDMDLDRARGEILGELARLAGRG